MADVNAYNSYYHITSATAPGIINVTNNSTQTTLVRVCINAASAGIVGIIDGGSGATVALFAASVAAGRYLDPIRLTGDLKINLKSHVGDIVLVYRQ